LLHRANKIKAEKKAEADKKAAEAGRHKTGGKGKQKQHGAGAKRKEEEEEEEEEIGEVSQDAQWTERGIPNFAGTEAHKKRHLREPTAEVSLSQSALDQLPSLDAFMDALD
ncbi:unnamed protein product, partial [Pylaiella littoralis]